MPLITSKQISRYYDLFKQVEVTFNTQVIQALGLLPREVHLKCLGEIIPCIIYSSSMTVAKVLAQLGERLFQTIRDANNSVSLRFSFKLQDKANPLSFFVTAKITGYTPYSKEKPGLHFVSLTYAQKPPDDLIEMLGELLEANVNAKKRKELRLIITPQSMKGLNLDARDTVIYIDSVPRKCIIRDLSFSGAKVLIVGIAKFLINKKAVLHLPFDSPGEVIKISGKIIRSEEVEGRKDITALAILFDEEKVPISYKKHINEYLRSPRHSIQQEQKEPRTNT